MQARYLLVRVKGELIPIGTCNGKIRGKKKQARSNKSNRKKIRPMYFRKHPVELLFAVTYHKLQGVTLDKLVLTIDKHPNRFLRIVLSSLYVGIFRVHNLSEVRVLLYTVQNYTNEGRWNYVCFANLNGKCWRRRSLTLDLLTI